MSEENQKVFNPREHLMQLKSREGSKDYLPVQWRLVWFREQCPNGTIETEMVHLDLTQPLTKETPVWNNEKRRSEKILKEAPGIAIFKAKASDGKGGMATGYGSESALDFGDFLEKAETKAIGRALAALGYGTQFAPELEEGARIVDAPVDRAPAAANGSNHANGNGAPRDENAAATATEQQVASIRKLCQHIGKSEPDNVTSISYLAAKRLIQQLTAEYKEARAKTNSSPSSEPATNNATPKPASPGLVLAARNLYIQAQEKAPDDLTQKSVEEIKKIMERLNGKLRDKINANNGHGPTSQPTSTVNAPDVKSLQKRCTQMGLNWDVIVTSALKIKVAKPDDNILPEECARIKEKLDVIEEQRSKNAPVEKAS